MPLPPAFLDELRNRVPLSDFIGKRVKLTHAGREHKGCCPFHNEKTGSFTVNNEKQFYHCFGCGAHGDIISFAMRHDGYSFPEAVEVLAGEAGMDVPKDTPEQRQRYDKQKRLYEVLEEATVFFEKQLRAPVGRESIEYFKGRGLTGETVARFRLGFAPADAKALVQYLLGKKYTIPEMLDVGLIKKSNNGPDHYSFFRGRVMFPVADSRGRTVAFGARILGQGEPKYLNSPDHVLFHKGNLLYGLSRAREALNQKQPLIVVEGYTDVIALAQSGYMGGMAPLGTALTENQIQLLWKLLPPVESRDGDRDYSPILCFDGDKAGVSAAKRSVERVLPLLSAGQTARIAYLPSGEDPDSLIQKSGNEAFQAVLDKAKPMIDVVWELTINSRNMETPEDRAAGSHAIRLKVKSIQDESVRSLYKNEIEKRLSELFTWKKPDTFQPWKKGQFNKKFNKNKLQAPINHRTVTPKSGLADREQILLALMVNHPELTQEFEEDIAKINFTTPALESLRQQLLTLFSDDSHESLDVEAITSHFSYGDAAKGSHKVLAKILSEATYVHADYARPDRPLEQARHGWISIWNKYLQEQLQNDLLAARRLWHEDSSDANYTRMMALRQQMEQLTSESTEQDTMAGDE